MKNSLWYLAAVAALAIGAILLPGETAVASNEIAKQEDLVCTACHDKPGSKLLTSQGKYYELMGTIDGYDQVTQAFGECTTCHVKKPGSVKLTKAGKAFQSLVGDMSGLKMYLQEEHPTADAPEEKPGSN